MKTPWRKRLERRVEKRAEEIAQQRIAEFVAAHSWKNGSLPLTKDTEGIYVVDLGDVEYVMLDARHGSRTFQASYFAKPVIRYCRVPDAPAHPADEMRLPINGYPVSDEMNRKIESIVDSEIERAYGAASKSDGSGMSMTIDEFVRRLKEKREKEALHAAERAISEAPVPSWRSRIAKFFAGVSGQ